MPKRCSALALFLLLLLLHCIDIVSGSCEVNCNGHGFCDDQDRCVCFKGRDGRDIYTGNDCALRTCPLGMSWVGHVVRANDLHPYLECSNMGTCNRQTGACKCFEGYDGVACERTVCPNDCSGQGICYTMKQMAEDYGREYSLPWDADKLLACVCDIGYRGLDCSMVECPSRADVSKGKGNESGRDCSGRGLCDYGKGICECFTGYYGVACDRLTTLIA